MLLSQDNKPLFFDNEIIILWSWNNKMKRDGLVVTMAALGFHTVG